MSLPNLFLFAAPRTGSTQLARWLDTHPEIALSKVKEPNYFAAHEFPEDYVQRTHLNDVVPNGPPLRPAQFAVFRKRCAYERLFDPLHERWRLDASTSYLACPEAAKTVFQTCPGARIIILTRDPVARAISHYRLALRTGQTIRSLDEEIEAELSGDLPLGARYLLRPSRQWEGIARVQRVFPPDQVLCLTFREFTKTPEVTLRKISAFLDIDDTYDLSVEARNQSYIPRFQRLNVWLQSSGAKTALRRILPHAAKPFLRRVWFEDKRIAVSEAEFSRLQFELAGP